MSALWLTYAWLDNEDQDVDHVAAELRTAGLEVRRDKTQLLAGRRLWDQIDLAISDPTVDAWAILVTENSLRSEPCQEELAYALDRALRTRGATFPIIGIFPRPIDRSLIPSSIATRKWVALNQVDWKEEVVAGVSGTLREDVAPPLPYGVTLHENGDTLTLEVWPRSGRWAPFGFGVPVSEKHLINVVYAGSRGYIPAGMVVSVLAEDARDDSGRFSLRVIGDAVDTINSGQAQLLGMPSQIVFGQADGHSKLWVLDPRTLTPAGK